jgi:hypothetical protein
MVNAGPSLRLSGGGPFALPLSYHPKEVRLLVPDKKPDVNPDELWGLWLSDDIAQEKATGYLIQIVKYQEGYMLKNGRHGIMLLRAEAEFRQRLDRLEKEVAQLRREIEELKKSHKGE